MKSKADLVQELDEARAEMQAVSAAVDTQMEIYPGWTIKHVLAHIAGWDDAVASSLRAHAGGKSPATPAVRGVDYYNAQSVATREALSYTHVVKEWELAREQLKAAILEMPPEKFGKPLLFPWGATGTVAQVVAIFASHELEHAQEIWELIEQAEEKKGESA